MKKQKKQTLVLLIVLLALVGGYFLSTKIPTDTEESTEEEEKVAVMDKDTVTDIYFNGSDGDVHLYKDAEDTWHVDGYDDKEVYSAAITGCLNGCTNMVVQSELDSTDYAEYGLDAADTIVKVQGTDGEHTVYFGSFNAAATVYYVMVDDDPTIYVYQHSETLPFQHETDYYLEDEEEETEESTEE